MKTINNKVNFIENFVPFILLLLGIFFFLSALFNWDFVCEPDIIDEKRFFFRLFGRTGLRWVYGIFSLFLIITSFLILFV